MRYGNGGSGDSDGHTQDTTAVEFAVLDQDRKAGTLTLALVAPLILTCNISFENDERDDYDEQELLEAGSVVVVKRTGDGTFKALQLLDENRTPDLRGDLCGMSSEDEEKTTC